MTIWKRRIAALLSAALLAMPLTVPVWAQEEPTPELPAQEAPVQEAPAQDPAELTPAQARQLVQSIATHLAIYARYEDITIAGLYRTALDQLLGENPDLYEEVLRAMLESIDEHSEYYDPQEAAGLMESVNGEVFGIGVTLDFTGPEGARVVSVIPDTPADRAGLQVGDILVSANGSDLQGLKSESILDLVRGPAGSSIHLEVKRDGGILAFDMVREAIIGTSIASQLYKVPEGRVMYIRIYGFVKNTAEKFREALDQADAAGVTNLILDLRDNGGGILDQAVEMADQFVPKGNIITTEDHKNELWNKVYRGDLVDKSKYDTVILINGNSASASEVFSAALHENQAATLIGERSYGKGTIQSINSLKTGGMIKYTMGFYLTPNGNNINGIGLEPDAYVENTAIPIDPDAYGTFGYTRTYQVGDTGEEIRTAKRILTLFGQYQGPIDDVFDQDLFYAVYAFQTQAQIFPYGVLDLTTQLQLRNHLGRAKLLRDDQLRAAFSHFGLSYPAQLEEQNGLD